MRGGAPHASLLLIAGSRPQLPHAGGVWHAPLGAGATWGDRGTRAAQPAGAFPLCLVSEERPTLDATPGPALCEIPRKHNCQRSAYLRLFGPLSARPALLMLAGGVMAETCNSQSGHSRGRADRCRPHLQIRFLKVLVQK
jgi:hypothetical protein